MNRIALTLLAAALLAACERTPEEARKILKEKKVPINEQNLLKQSKSAKTDETATLLVEAGVNPNTRQENGMTVLMSAVLNRQPDTVEALLKRGADVHASAKGFNALSLAAERGDVAIAKLLLEAGASPDEKAENGPSAMEKAQAMDRKEIIELFRKVAK